MAEHIIYLAVKALCYILLRVCFLYQIKGKENIPAEGAFIVASNHVSFLDPVAVGVAFRQKVYFMARHDLFGIKILGPLIRILGAYPIHKGHKDLTAIKGSLKMLQEGKPLMMFPEGQRTVDAGPGRPQTGIGMLMARSGAGVLPIYVKGSENAIPRKARFIRFKPVELRIGKIFRPEPPGDPAAKKELYQQFSDKVMEHIWQLRDMK